MRRKLPFFPDLHHEISRSWKQPFSSRLTNAASADFTNLVGSVEREPASASSSRERPALRKLAVGRVSDPVHQMETVRPLIVPGPFPLRSSTPPNFRILVLGSVNCPVGSVLEFLQDKFSAGAAATTLRVYVAAIPARRDSDDVPLGRHRLVSCFMRGVKCLRPVRPPSFPSWDLSVVLKGLLVPPFEPLESASLAYEVRSLPSPLNIRAHSTRGVASSQALFRGVPLEDICMAAGWSSTHTFVRFSNLDVNTAPGSQVLSV